MDDEHAPQTASVASVHEILYRCFSLLFGEAVEINMILHRYLPSFQPSHQFSAEAFDGSLDVFIAERDVQLHGALHQAMEVSHGRFLVVRRGVGGLGMAGPGPWSLFLFMGERGNAVHGFEEGLQFPVSFFLNVRFGRGFFGLGFENLDLFFEPLECRVKEIFFFSLHDETILSLDLRFVNLL